VDQASADEASEALAGWAKLNGCRALGAFIPGEIGVKGYAAGSTNTGPQPTQLHVDLRPALFDPEMVGQAFDLLRRGGKIWLLVEEP
jgi:hypothetical protein